MNYVNFKYLEPIERILLYEAEIAMKKAYCPYSHFSVGATLLTLDQRYFISGSNVENAAFGSTLCAERSAIVKANSEGHRKFKAIALIAKHRDFDTEDITAPCGACRQMLFEAAQLADYNMKIILANTKMSKIMITSIYELLPLGFGPKDLQIDLGGF